MRSQSFTAACETTNRRVGKRRRLAKCECGSRDSSISFLIGSSMKKWWWISTNLIETCRYFLASGVLTRPFEACWANCFSEFIKNFPLSYWGSQSYCPRGPIIKGKGESCNSKSGWEKEVSVHGVFKLSHVVDCEPILLLNLSTYFLLDTGKLILLLLEANIEKMETPTVIFSRRKMIRNWKFCRQNWTGNIHFRRPLSWHQFWTRPWKKRTNVSEPDSYFFPQGCLIGPNPYNR